MRSPSPFTTPLLAAPMLLPAALLAQQTIIGQAAFADWNQQQPGVRRKITLADLPQPNPEEAVNNTPHVVPRPANAWPIPPRRLQSHALRWRRLRSHAAGGQQKGDGSQRRHFHHAAPHPHRSQWRSLS